MYESIKDGYRLIDTAQYYGDEVGIGIPMGEIVDIRGEICQKCYVNYIVFI